MTIDEKVVTYQSERGVSPHTAQFRAQPPKE